MVGRIRSYEEAEAQAKERAMMRRRGGGLRVSAVTAAEKGR